MLSENQIEKALLFLADEIDGLEDRTGLIWPGDGMRGTYIRLHELLEKEADAPPKPQEEDAPPKPQEEDYYQNWHGQPEKDAYKGLGEEG